MKKTFREAADARLSALQVDRHLQARISESLNQVFKPSPSRLKPRLAFILTFFMVLLLAVAFALTEGFGLLQVMQIKEEYQTPISTRAQKLVVRALARHEFEHTEVVIQEALYDGKMLRVLYSVRDLKADAPFAPAGSELPPDFVFQAADKDGISWNTLDGCEVDNQPVSAIGITGSVAGELNGQVLILCQFDLSGVQVSNPFSVLLPIAGQNTPENLRFELPSYPLSGVIQLPLPKLLTLPDRNLQVTNALWSPIRVYLTLDIMMAPGVPEETCHETLWRWTMDAKLSDANTGVNYPLVDVSSGYSSNTEFAPDLGDFRHRILDPKKPVTMSIRMEFTSPETLPDRRCCRLVKKR